MLVGGETATGPYDAAPGGTVQALHALAAAVATGTEPGPVLAVLAEQAVRVLDADYGWVTLLAPNRTVTRHGAWGVRTDVWRRPAGSADGPPILVARVLAARRSVVFAGLGEPAGPPLDAFPTHRAESGRTVLGIPLASRGVVVGILVIGWRRDVEPPASQLRLAETLGSQAALFLDVVRAQANAATHSTTVQELATERRVLVEQLPCGVVVVDAAGCQVLVNDAARELLALPPPDRADTVPPRWASPLRDATTRAPLPPEQSPVGRALRGEHVAETEYRVPRAVPADDGWVRVSAMPLRDAAGAVSGAVAVFTDVTRERRLVDDLAASGEQLRRINAFARTVSHTLDLHSLLNSVVRDAGPLLHGACSYVMEYQPAVSAFRLRAYWSETTRLGVWPDGAVRTDGALSGAALCSARACTIADTRQASAAEARAAAEHGTLSLACVPIVVAGAVWGTLTVGWSAVGAATPERVAVLEAFAGHLALGLKNASLYCELQEAHEDLKRAQRQVVQQERLHALGEMASGIAHDFNNALAPLQGFSELLLTNTNVWDDRPTVRRYLELMNTAAGGIL